MENLIQNGKPTTGVPEQVLHFKKYSDARSISIKDENGNILASLNGYGIEFGFDYKCVRTSEEIAKTASYIADVVIRIMTDAALEAANKSNTDTEK